MRPYYEQSGVTIYHGDCREILPQLRADVIVTDPPYNCGRNYGDTTNDRLPWPEWCGWFDGVLVACRATAPDVLAFLSQTAYRQYVKHGLVEMDWSLVWIKPLSLAVCAAPFMPHWEPIGYWGDKKKGQVQWGSDVVTANVEFGKTRWDHPTPKPVAAMLSLVSKFSGVICDPFAGSGTTLFAAKQIGLRSIGIEINERYCETMAKRLQQEALPLEMGA